MVSFAKTRLIRKPLRLRFVVLAVLVVMVGCVLFVGVLVVRHARQKPDGQPPMDGCARCTLRFRTTKTDTEHCPRFAYETTTEIPSTVAPLILPHLDPVRSLMRLDLSQPWNSDYNRKVVGNVSEAEWTWFARDLPSGESPVRTHIFAFLGTDSIWEAATGIPRGTTREHPNEVMLISVPQSDIEPMQPGDISEDEVRKMVEDGQEVLFVMAGTEYGYRYGVVKIEDGRLVFPTSQEVRDKKALRQEP